MSDLFLCLDTSTPTARVAILDGAGGVRLRGGGDRGAALQPRAAAVRRGAARGLDRARGPGRHRLRRRPGQLHRAARRALDGQGPRAARPGFRCTWCRRCRRSRSTSSRRATARRHRRPCLDAGKGEVYVGGYVADDAALVRETAADCRIAAGALGDWLAALPAPPPAVAGNGAERHAVAGRLAVAGPTAVSIGRLALLQRRRGEVTNLASAVPIYGRPPDITVKKVRKQAP